MSALRLREKGPEGTKMILDPRRTPSYIRADRDDMRMPVVPFPGY
jgi:hypothetical protein